VISALLVDTHLVLWARVAPERLTMGERRALDDARSCYVSAASLWEIAILMTLDRIGRDERLVGVPDGFDLLPVLPDHCRALIALPRRHRDPFDRMLIAQARSERLPLLTRDREIIAYGTASADGVTFDGRP
jgi:PIN domain nuclease of toxin-antitoxin system